MCDHPFGKHDHPFGVLPYSCITLILVFVKRFLVSHLARELVAVIKLLERTRGAGAPEVLRRETAEEEFRLRRNQPLNMAPSAPKDRYCQADFFCATFSKKSIFFGALQMLYRSLIRVIFGTLFGTLKKVCQNLHMKPMLLLFGKSRGNLSPTDRHTNASHLESGAVD